MKNMPNGSSVYKPIPSNHKLSFHERQRYDDPPRINLKPSIIRSPHASQLSHIHLESGSSAFRFKKSTCFSYLATILIISKKP